MLTRNGRGNPLPQKPIEDAFARTRDTHDRFSLRPRDAIAGSVTLIAVVLGVLIIREAVYFGEERTVLSRMLSITIFVFAPAILTALYSLFFEKSKVYGGVDLLLAGVVLLKLPFTWYWLEMYWPVACGFTLFCAAVRMFDHRWRE
jgi:hypothetical protein